VWLIDCACLRIPIKLFPSAESNLDQVDERMGIFRSRGVRTCILSHKSFISSSISKLAKAHLELRPRYLDS
jgi:hypothetical protein